MGTLEEKIDAMLESKRDLADLVVGTDEGWLTELDYGTLHSLVALEPDADIMSEDEATNKNGNITVLPKLQTAYKDKAPIIEKGPNQPSLKTKIAAPTANIRTASIKTPEIKTTKKKKIKILSRKGTIS
jgi:hypothetical protein